MIDTTFLGNWEGGAEGGAIAAEIANQSLLVRLIQLVLFSGEGGLVILRS